MLNIEAFSKSLDDNISFFYGMSFSRNFALDNVISNNKSVYLNIEEPNGFFVQPYDTYNTRFDKIFTICPYTRDWLNQKEKSNKRVETFYPIHKQYIPKKQEKIYDVIYAGSILDGWIKNIIVELKKYNSAIVSHSKSKLVTHYNLKNEKKLNIYAKSKMAIVHNCLFLSDAHIQMIMSQSDWNKNEAFKHIDKKVCPQLKSRLFEAAMTRNIILCKRDYWNIIERYFVPGEDFLYFDSDEDLNKLIQEISVNYYKYEHIAENAFNKFFDKYTTDNFVDIIKSYI
jgi:spore maturation protein CgeB